MLRSTTVAMLFGRVGAASLAMAMAEIKATAGFDPREPPQHRTAIDVGVYVEHLLDVSIEEHTFDMDFYLTQEWLDGRNFSALFSDWFCRPLAFCLTCLMSRASFARSENFCLERERFCQPCDTSPI